MSTIADNRPVRWLRPTTGGGLLIVLASIGLSLLAHEPLGQQLRIRWTVGPHYHVGPEYAPALPVLIGFPVVMVALFAGANWLRRRFERSEEPDGVRPVYEIAVCTTLLLVVVVQGGLIAANLVL